MSASPAARLEADVHAARTNGIESVAANGSKAALASFVGRQAELGALAGHREAVRAGSPRLVIVEGAAGIGKTAFVNAFLDQARGFQVVRASGDESEMTLAYGVIDQLMRVAGATGPEVLAEAKRAPSADDHVSVGMSVLQLLGRLQDDGPVVLVVDDAHWADEPSLRALLFATRRLVADAVLVLMVIRDQDSARLPDGLIRCASSSMGARLPLGPLAVEDLQALAAAVGVRLSSRAARRLHEHTSGSPLYARALLSETPVDAWRRDERPLPAPRSFSELVAGRLDGCSASARRLVEAAAVLGGRSPLMTAAAVGSVDDPLAALEEAAAATLLREPISGHRHETEFTHPLVRAAVYHHLGAARRAQLHAAAAEVVEHEGAALRHRTAASPGADPVLARELEEHASIEAARGAWVTAADSLVAASLLSDSQEDRSRRLLAATDALVFAGDVEGGKALAAEVGALPAGPRRDAVLGHVALFGASLGEAERLLCRAWDQCDPERNPQLAANIARSLAMHWLLRLNGRETETWARRAIEAASERDPASLNARAVLSFGMALGGRCADGVRALHDSRALMPADNGFCSDPMLGWLLLAQDDVSGARAELADATPAAMRVRSFDASALAHAARARVEFAAGQWDDAAYYAERGVAIVADFDRISVRLLVRWAAVLVPAARGDWDTADAHVRAATTRPLVSEEELTVGGITVALVASARQRYDDVLRALEPVVRIEPREGVDEPGLMPWQDLYAEALVGAGRLDEAAAFLPDHEERAAARGLRSAITRLARARGRLEAARSCPRQAGAAFRLALDTTDGLDMPFERALAEFAFGQFLRRQGQRRAADTLLRAAHETFVVLEAAPHAERCARELEACGLAPAKRGDADRDTLTPQERSIARLVVSGLSNREVGAELLVSVKTVEVHLTRIYAKLGVKSRSQLAVQMRPPLAS